ncbi:MAG: peroxiredoxin [Myxococcota bacterium]|jgi:peroxiredoxin Q/BCP|nr:peroxiredoxin [Myxococcota bacterium]
MLRIPTLIFFVAISISCSASQRTDGGSGLLPSGSAAPDLSGVDQNDTAHSLKETLGSPTVVYFYPKDETPGCTKEACAFRGVWKQYEAAGVKLFGVSKDTMESHKEFAARHSLSFPLISDNDGAWAAAFGVSETLGMYQRVTFLIGRDGKVLKVYDNVDPGLHALEVLKDIESLAP